MTVISRRYLFAVATVSAVASTSSCATIKNLAKNIGSSPAVKELIGEVAKEVGADLVLKGIKYAANHLSEWRNYIDSKVEEWVSDGRITDCDDDDEDKDEGVSMWTDNPDSPTIIVKELHGSHSFCEANSSNSCCAIFFNGASDAFLLPTWAWMTLREFAKKQYSDKEGADLKRRQAFLRLALRPSSSHVERHETLGKVVADTVCWKTIVGQVDMAKIEKSDHTYKGAIKVSGYPDEKGPSAVDEIDLSGIVQ